MDKTEKYSRGKHPNSRKNLKTTAGPGRPPLSPEEKVARLEIRQHMKAYLSDGGAASDFEKIRTRKPEVALDLALNRVYGRTDKPTSDVSRGQINVLIQILTGQIPQAGDNLLKPSDNLIEESGKELLFIEPK